MSLNLHQLLVSRFFFQNFSYIIVDEKTHKAVIIDPAWRKNVFTEAVKNLGIELSAILLTHHHFDHVGVSKSLAVQYKVPIYMSQIEVDYYKLKHSALRGFADCEPISFGQSNIIPFLTPGHTKGGVCYAIDHALFTGDTLFLTGCGYARTKGGGSSAELFASLQRIKREFSDDTVIYPGHPSLLGGSLPLSVVKKKNLYLLMNDQDQFCQFLDRPRVKRGSFIETILP